MNQAELNELSELVERRLTIRSLLKDWESGGGDQPLTPSQREAVRELLREKIEDCLRLEMVVNRLADRVDGLESQLGEAPRDPRMAARVGRIRRQMDELGESIRRFRSAVGPLNLGEVHTAALVDPYVDDTAPLAERVRVSEGDL